MERPCSLKVVVYILHSGLFSSSPNQHHMEGVVVVWDGEASEVATAGLILSQQGIVEEKNGWRRHLAPNKEEWGR